MRHRRLLAVILILTSFLLGHGQEMPKIISPSPETAALFKYQEYPMDYSTGVPQISIPLFELRSGTLSIPVSVSYHASGRRVTDEDGPIALGWSLSAGGMIAKTTYGAQDFSTQKFPTSFKGANNIHPTNDVPYLQEIFHSINYPSPGLFKDSEYDVFSYNMNSLSGKFIFKDSAGIKVPALLPYKPYKIQPIVTTVGLSGVNIIDDHGITYFFAPMEMYSVFAGSGYTGFPLMRIVSASKVDTIKFTYQPFAQTHRRISQSWVLDDRKDVTYGTALDMPQQLESSTDETYWIARLTKIESRQGEVVFNLRPNSDRVESIFLKDGFGELVKTVSFDVSLLNTMTDGNRPANKLDRINFNDRNNLNPEVYELEYYPVFLPTGFTQMDLRYCDYWGYYNASGAHRMVPAVTIPFLSPSQTYNMRIGDEEANRAPNLDGLRSGVIRKIKYPTGGSSEFIFENNRYKSLETNQVLNGPGLRVSQIITTDDFGNSTYRTYRYGDSENGYSFLDVEPTLSNMSLEMNTLYLHCATGDAFTGDCGSFRRRTFLADFVPGVSAAVSRPLIYSTVVEYHGTVSKNAGKTIYKYENTQWTPSTMPGGSKHIYDWNYWNSASLVYQGDFLVSKTNGADTYKRVKESWRTYAVAALENVMGLHVQRWWDLPQTGPTTINVENTAANMKINLLYVPQPLIIFSYVDYRIPVGVKNLATVTDSLFYDDGSSSGTTVQYQYNSKQYVAGVSHIGSDGVTWRSETKFPFDFPGTAVLAQMVKPNVNMLNYPVQQNELRDKVVTKRVRTNYARWGSANFIIAPETVDVDQGAGSFETRLRYYQYDSDGNPERVCKEHDVIHAYIWDYQRAHPIAEVVSSTQSRVAYTSFEADGSGNWTSINSSHIANTGRGFTGRRYYNLSRSVISCSGLSPSVTYIVSYWSQGSACVVSGSRAGWPKNLGTALVDRQTWNFWQHEVANATAVNVSGNVNIDELRLYPKGAQMKTYSYDPLIGMTSQVDDNGVITHYEYDSHGRLVLIRDSNWNIVRSMKYQFKER